MENCELSQIKQIVSADNAEIEGVYVGMVIWIRM